MVRGGFGVFYDLSYSFARTALSANNYPYARALAVSNVTPDSYTFAKSLDVVSEESFQNLQSPTGRFDPQQDRGPSSFDLRHAFNATVSIPFSLFTTNL